MGRELPAILRGPECTAGQVPEGPQCRASARARRRITGADGRSGECGDWSRQARSPGQQAETSVGILKRASVLLTVGGDDSRLRTANATTYPSSGAGTFHGAPNCYGSDTLLRRPRQWRRGSVAKSLRKPPEGRTAPKHIWPSGGRNGASDVPEASGRHARRSGGPTVSVVIGTDKGGKLGKMRRDTLRKWFLGL